MHFFLGIDVSTTATKALLIDIDGEVIGVAFSEYTFDTPFPLWSEQHPDLWWNGAIKCVKQLINKVGVSSKEISCIGLTGQMHGLVLLGENGDVLRPAILWNDQRTSVECEEIRNILGKTRLIQLTGNDALTGFTAPKLLWVKNNEPDIYNRIRHVLLPKDYLRWRLTGSYATDRAGGSGTLLFDLKERDWSKTIIEALEINPHWLPPTYEGTYITGEVSPTAAEETGLKAGTPVVAGGGDQAAQAVGVGAVQPGIIALTLGTSGVVFTSTDNAIIDPQARLHAFCHALPRKWHLMGVMLSAGGSLRWFRDCLAPNITYDELTEHALSIPAGSEGLIFLPYLTGERTPHPDPLARGAFVGLNVRHSINHMTRAVLEGVSYGLRDNFELMRSTGIPPIQEIRVSGGGARSAMWRNILANVLQVELVTINSTEGAAFGAALLAAVGVGYYPNVETACRATIHIVDRIYPSHLKEVYNEYYYIYRSLYPALHKSFDDIYLVSQRF